MAHRSGYGRGAGMMGKKKGVYKRPMRRKTAAKKKSTPRAAARKRRRGR